MSNSLLHLDLLPLFAMHAAARRAAIDDIPDSIASAYALRQVLLADTDATVRAHAAERLGRMAARLQKRTNNEQPASAERPEMEGRAFVHCLQEACDDSHASVRDAAYRGLGRLRAPAAVPRLARACTSEPVWSARRSAVVALVATAGAQATGALMAALDDPFWRVRHAAIQALAVLAANHPDVRESVLCAPRTSDTAAWAIEYLRRGLTRSAQSPVEPEPRPVPPRRADRSIDPAWDADPAVMTARFEDPSMNVSRALLLEAIADSHEPLRKVAATRLRACGDMRTYAAALLWLDEPRIPHAAASVRTVLDQLDDRAADLASDVLDPERGAAYGPGARVWALSWVARTRHHEFMDAVLALAGADCPDSVVRAGAVDALAVLAVTRFDTGAPEQVHISMDRVVSALERAARDAHDDVKLAAIRGLAQLRAPGARAVLASLPYAESPAPVRRVLIHDAVKHGSLERLRQALTVGDEPDAWCRAQAVAALDANSALDPAVRARVAADPDPWLRVAALDQTGALAALGIRDDAAGHHAGDPDPLVRRAAMDWIMTSCPATVRARVGLHCVTAGDPWVRARACLLLGQTSQHDRHGSADRDLRDDGSAGHERVFHALLLATRDSEPMVRAAAADSLNTWQDLDAALEQLVLRGQGSDALRQAAYTWLARRFDDDAAERIAGALTRGSESAAVTEHLRAMELAFADPAALATPAIRTAHPARPNQARTGPLNLPRRPLGRTNIEVSPLAVSGVFELSGGSLMQAHDAGVNLFFWEPRYRAMTRFLRASAARRQNLVLAAGTFHAGPAAIKADVDSALRRLRTDHIDIFLLFWVRSAARLSDETRNCLDALARQGKIRAAGFSTHDRGLAARALGAHPWDVVMVRHSAAHRGAEDDLFPLARERGTGVLTFSALCYGRMLRSLPGTEAPPSAADCYRYSLSQDGVSACISAPRRHAELVHNLGVLGEPMLAPDRMDALRAHGQRVYQRNKDFNALIRREPARGLVVGRNQDTLFDELLDDVAPPGHF